MKQTPFTGVSPPNALLGTTNLPFDPDSVEIELLPPEFNPGGFDCGKADLNEYMTEGDAVRDMAAKVSLTYIVHLEGRFVGYFSVLTDAIRLQTKEKPQGIPYSNAPAVKLGRLAVCQTDCGCGLGSHLLKYVIGMARDLSESIGCRYVTLDSHADKVDWYSRRGFVHNEGERRVRKIYREVMQRIGQEIELPNVSMRYDLLLEEEVPPSH